MTPSTCPFLLNCGNLCMVHINTLEIQMISIIFLAQTQSSQCPKHHTLMFLLTVPIAVEW